MRRFIGIVFSLAIIFSGCSPKKESPQTSPSWDKNFVQVFTPSPDTATNSSSPTTSSFPATPVPKSLEHHSPPIIAKTVIEKFLYQSPASEDVQKTVSLTMRKKGERLVAIDINVIWEPGAAVDVRTDKITQDSSKIAFVFIDSFGNQGRGSTTTNGDNLTLKLDVLKSEDSRAARQLGDYTLKRVE